MSDHRLPVSTYQLDILRIVNNIRSSNGLNTLNLNSTLSSCARYHCEDQAYNIGDINHIGSDGSSLQVRLSRVGYKFQQALENLARGQESPEEAMTDLMKSPGHRSAILSPNVKEMGLYVVRGPDRHNYWTQIFGLPQSKRSCCRHRHKNSVHRKPQVKNVPHHCYRN